MGRFNQAKWERKNSEYKALVSFNRVVVNLEAEDLCVVVVIFKKEVLKLIAKIGIILRVFVSIIFREEKILAETTERIIEAVGEAAIEDAEG